MEFPRGTAIPLNGDSIQSKQMVSYAHHLVAGSSLALGSKGLGRNNRITYLDDEMQSLRGTAVLFNPSKCLARLSFIMLLDHH